MHFTETKLKGAFVVDLECVNDERGFFARTFCAEEFAAQGLKPVVMQANTSLNHKKGTLRGLHYQLAPAEEAKFIRCTAGAVFDLIVDLRKESSSYMKHFGVELSASNRRALYIPQMFAHAYLTLSDNAEVCYQVSEIYTPNVERGFRYNDPALGIQWPIDISVISEKDASWPLIDSSER